MKYLRILSIILCCVLLVGMLVACKDDETADTDAKTEPVASDSVSDTDPADTDPADTDPADTDPADTDPADTEPQPPYTGPAIRDDAWNTGDITPGSSNVALESGANDPSVEWN